MHFNNLRQTYGSISTLFEWITPCSSSTIKTILYYTDIFSVLGQCIFKYSRPSFIEWESLSCIWDNPPSKTVCIYENLIHALNILPLNVSANR